MCWRDNSEYGRIPSRCHCDTPHENVYGMCVTCGGVVLPKAGSTVHEVGCDCGFCKMGTTRA